MKEISKETYDFIMAHRIDNPAALALTARNNPEVDMSLAVTQVAGRQIATQKVPTWADNDNIIYPRHLSMEQCSSEATALYKASLVGGETLADLTGGWGVDCWFMSRKFTKTIYIERDEELCEIAEHNFHALGTGDIDVRHGESTGLIDNMESVDWIFIDPARRNEHGGKTVQIADCEPDVSAIEERLLGKAKKVMVKLSPMLDITLAAETLRHISEVHIVSVGNECKELLLILDSSVSTNEETRIHCVNISGGKRQTFNFSRREEHDATCEHSDRAERYLYEPNAAVMKGGAFKSVASAFGVRKLHPNSHLYTSELLRNDFPGRVFEVVRTCSLNKRELKEALAGIGHANISVRNFPASVAELRKRTKLHDGGDTYIFATTLNNGDKILAICRKVETGR